MAGVGKNSVARERTDLRPAMVIEVVDQHVPMWNNPSGVVFPVELDAVIGMVAVDKQGDDSGILHVVQGLRVATHAGD